MKVVIIADDLTGALDSAVAFAVRGLRTVCARTIGDLEAALELGADAIAVSTGSRELDEAEAMARVALGRSTLQADPAARAAIWFKKIDSRLKGHVAAEITALASSGQSIAVCPAIPRLGRHVISGAVSGRGVERPIPVAGIAGVDPSQVIDATTDSDLDEGLSFVPSGGLLVGAAGLAEALARRLRPGVGPALPPDIHAPALIAIGSRDPVTLAQLDGLERVCAPNGVVPASQKTRAPWTLVQLTAGPIDIAPTTAADAFAGGIAARVRAEAPATLIVSGGETAAAIMHRLGIGLLEVAGEALPGLPVSRTLDGQENLAIVTKSGGFGGPDTLVDLIGKLVKSS